MIELGTEDTVPEKEPNDFEIKGRPIEGDVHRSYRDNRPPATAAQFTEAIDAVLGIPGVHAVRWNQYTPSFNDGDPCEFTVHDLSIRLTPLDDEDDERGDYEDGFIDSWSLGYMKESNELPELNDETIAAVKKASNEWDALAKDEVCRQNFGDPGQVTATVEGFSVDYYDHD